MIYTREDLEMMAELSGGAFVTVILAQGDKAWNPDRNDTLLRGPGRVTYAFWTAEEVDFSFHAMEPTA